MSIKHENRKNANLAEAMSAEIQLRGVFGLGFGLDEERVIAERVERSTEGGICR